MTTLTQVTPRLPVRELRRTIDFYTQQLGFTVAVLWPDQGPTFAILCRDATSIGFFEPTDHQGDIGYAELYIQVTDCSKLHSSLGGRVPIEWGPEVYAYGRREFALRDPDGYLIIFTEATDDPATTSEPAE